MIWPDDEKVSPKTEIPQLFKKVDENKSKFIDSLKEPVSIPSVSGDPDHFNDIIKLLHRCGQKLEDLGASIDIIDVNSKDTSDLPPVLFAKLSSDKDYSTICVYGNIDIVAPKPSENVKDCPFKLVERDGRLYGCGVSDNKAPLFCWFNALKTYKMTKTKIPVNIKFVIEGTSELYSKSLFRAILKNREFFNDVEYICMTIDKKVNETPCLKYGYRGICLFQLFISCGEKRVHSGTFGGAFNQPLMDGVHIIGSLIDKHGKITLQNVLNDVKPIKLEDEKRCEKEFCPIDAWKKKNGICSLTHNEKASRIIMHKTLLPSITVHAFQIKSAAADKHNIASIPNKIEVAFSVRLVPNQTVDKINEQFQSHIEKTWDKYKSPNMYQLRMEMGFNPWHENPLSEHYKAAARSIKTVYKKSPIYLSEGTTMPAVSILGTTCSASNIIVMPISGFNDHPHSELESIAIDDYINGIKLAIAYMCEIHEINQ